MAHNILKDHRLIYVFYILLVLFPFLVPIGLPMTIDAYVRDGFNFISSIPAGSTILVSIDFRMMSWSEIGPGAVTIMQQVIDKPIKLVLISLIPEGPVLADKVLSMVNMRSRVYGVDWVNVGYVPGRDTSCVAMAEDFKSIVKADYKGTPVESIPLMSQIKDAGSFYGILTFEDEGTPWPLYWNLVKHVSIVKTGQALLLSSWLVEWQAKMEVGMAAGVRGYAEWEALLGVKGANTMFMDAVNVAWFYLLLMMAIGNIEYFRRKRTTSRSV